MPFQRIFDPDTSEFIIDRDLTGPPKPVVLTGTTKAEDGTIVATSDTIVVPPATPVQVNLPSPFEPIIDANGRITPNWWKFLNELYQRTGGNQDNIIKISTTWIVAGSPDALIFTGAAPSVEIDHIRQVGTASITTTGATPTIGHFIDVPVGSILFAGKIPTIP